MKGFLTANSIKFKKTHNLGELIIMVAKIDEKLASKLRSAKKLSIYAVTYRYPDAELEPLTLKMVNDAIKIAQKVLLQLAV